MIKINPQFVYEEEGKKRGVLLKMRVFDRVVANLEDLYDYKMVVERAHEIDEKTYSLEEVMKEIDEQ